MNTDAIVILDRIENAAYAMNQVLTNVTLNVSDVQDRLRAGQTIITMRRLRLAEDAAHHHAAVLDALCVVATALDIDSTAISEAIKAGVRQ